MTDAIDIQGGLLSRDFLGRLRTGDVPGGKAGDYDVAGRLEDRVTAAWNELRNAWGQFNLKRSLQKSPTPEEAYQVTRDNWVRFVFDVLRYGHLVEERAPLRVEDKTYPIRFTLKGIPIHVVPYTQDLDVGPAGTARGNPHSLLQEYLNRVKSDAWGIVTNGREWRILRNNAASTRASYISFDLEQVMEQFDAFALWWRLAHASRILPRGDEAPWLEKWMLDADRQGTRALDDLRKGVEAAIEQLGQGFLKHPLNKSLLGRLQRNELASQEYYHQVLRLVYRLIFLFVTEARGLLLDPKAPQEVRELYAQHYGATRLLAMSTEMRGSQHHDLFEGLKVVMGGLKSAKGQPALAIPALNSALWSNEFIPDLDASCIRNVHFLGALRKLARVESQGVKRKVDYEKLGAEELGGIYESLLELNASVDPANRRFSLVVAAGHERKTTGSYYTPTEIVELALDEALNPVLDGIPNGPGAEEAILKLKVCDPTCGSGHFLIGAANRIAKRLAAARTGETEPPRPIVLHALRDVISHCIYGVDINPMAVELCKVGLWLEAMEPGKPLAFLEHRIKVGNAFLGATPAMLASGIPDAAYTPLDLDDAVACKELRKENKEVREALSKSTRLTAYMDLQRGIAQGIAHVDAMPADSVADIDDKEREYRRIVLASSEYEDARRALDVLCAAWTYVKGPVTMRDARGTAQRAPHITTQTLVQVLDRAVHDPAVIGLIDQEHARHNFFHWHLEFPDVFTPDRGSKSPVTGGEGGFDAIVGNPPWERPKIQEEEWFAPRRPEIANAPNAAARKKLIAALAEQDPLLMRAFLTDRRAASAATSFVRDSGGWPLTGHGDLNTYSVIAELSQNLSSGRTALVLPTQICTDHTTRRYVGTLIRQAQLRSVTSFVNEERLFPGVHHVLQFCVFTTSKASRPDDPVRFVFFAYNIEQARDPGRMYHLTPDMVQKMNPNTGTAPVFKSKADADLAAKIYAGGRPLLLEEEAQGYERLERNPFRISFQAMFHMANDSNLFVSHAGYEHQATSQADSSVSLGTDGVPLYEAKMIHLFDHRFGTYRGQTEEQANMGHIPKLTDEEKSSPFAFGEPRYKVHQSELVKRDQGRWPTLAWRQAARGADQRTMIVSLVPRAAVGHSLFLMHSERPFADRLLLLASLGSLTVDFALRTSMVGTNVSYYLVQQLPVPAPEDFERLVPGLGVMRHFISPRIAELTVTDYAVLGQDVTYPAPFTYDGKRRPVLQAELDAAFCLFYGLDRSDVEHLLESFSALSNQEVRKFGEFRTKRLVLETYEAMAAAKAQGKPYVSKLDPPPGHPSLMHSKLERTAQATQVAAQPAKGQQKLAGQKQAKL